MEIKELKGNRVLVEIIEVENENVTDGGVLLPDNATSVSPRLWIGKVIAVGPGLVGFDGIKWEPGVEVGDHVLLPKGGEDVKINKKLYRLYQGQEIIAIVEI